MRFHVVSLPHTQTTREYSWCAYTDKVRKFCDMMFSLGHEVYLYAGEENEANCTELITCVTKQEQRDWWPEWDYKKDMWPDGWRTDAPWWTTMNGRAADAIREREAPGDILCIIAGVCQQSLANEFPHLRPVEWGIGYEGVFAAHKVFESYAWMHHVYGRQQIANGIFYDAVIPNFFDPEDFLTWSAPKDDYLLYIGRVTERKGIQIVKDIIKRTGRRLLVAGQGNLSLLDDIDYEYQGVVGPQQRNELMAHATAVLVPTLYIEPFGGVAVEAQLSGTPVITTDWGAFPETVVDGRTGRRCRLLRDFVEAIEEVESYDSDFIRHHAEAYLTSNVRWRYDHYFKDIKTLDGEGWYT